MSTQDALHRDDEGTLKYPGWQVTAAAFVGVMTSFSPIVPYTFSLFLGPLHAAFGWQREAISGTFALAAITVALVSPGIGVLFDRFAPRRIILPCIVAFALALASLSLLGPNIKRFYLTYFVLGLVANGTAQFAYTHTILTWFRRHRGFALALLLTGSGVGSILIPPATQWVISHYGWRDAYLMLGGIALCGLPLTALFVRNRDVSVPQDVPGEATGVSVASALRTASFWILALIIMLSAFNENGLVTNLAAMLSEHGVSASSAALALSVRGGAGIIGRLCTGALIDRFSAQRIQTIILSFTVLGTVVLAYSGTSLIALLGAALLGIGLGSEADIVPYLLSRYFGRKHFSVIYGLTWTAYAIGGATGPMVVGHLYDRFGAYQPRFIVGLACVALLATLLSLLLRGERSQHPATFEEFTSSELPLEE